MQHVNVTHDHRPTFLSSVRSGALDRVFQNLRRAVHALWLTPEYMESFTREEVAGKALGPLAAARYLAAERDGADSFHSLCVRGAAHSRRLAEQRRTRLHAEIVREALGATQRYGTPSDASTEAE